MDINKTLDDALLYRFDQAETSSAYDRPLNFSVASSKDHSPSPAGNRFAHISMKAVTLASSRRTSIDRGGACGDKIRCHLNLVHEKLLFASCRHCLQYSCSSLITLTTALPFELEFVPMC